MIIRHAQPLAVDDARAGQQVQRGLGVPHRELAGPRLMTGLRRRPRSVVAALAVGRGAGVVGHHHRAAIAAQQVDPGAGSEAGIVDPERAGGAAPDPEVEPHGGLLLAVEHHVVLGPVLVALHPEVGVIERHVLAAEDRRVHLAGMREADAAQPERQVVLAMRCDGESGHRAAVAGGVGAERREAQ